MSTSPQDGLWVELTCDGNRRYEVDELAENGTPKKKDELSPQELFHCYQVGGESVKSIIEVSRDEGVGLIAPWAWSTKNWQRPKEHAAAVFKVTQEFLQDLENNWIDLPENEDVRLLHIGHKQQLNEAAPDMMKLMRRISECTKERRGMVVALLLDYDGPDEAKHAREQWRMADDNSDYESHLFLPRAGIAYKHIDLRIRTGEEDRIKHVNAVMQPYESMETRDIFHEVMLPDYTPEMYKKDLADLRVSEKRAGK